MCSVLALTACGGDNTAEHRASTGPEIEAAVAEQLASSSDKVASLLDAGDSCGAKTEAAHLREELTQAINARRIPKVYLEDLSATVNEIDAQIVCQEEAQVPPPPREDDHNEGKQKGKKKHKHKDEE